MHTATLIAADVEDVRGVGNIYALDPPLDGLDFVLVCAVHDALRYRNSTEFEPFPETLMFGWDADAGRVVGEWHHLEGSIMGTADHDAALRLAGYEPSA